MIEWLRNELAHDETCRSNWVTDWWWIWGRAFVNEFTGWNPFVTRTQTISSALLPIQKARFGYLPYARIAARSQASAVQPNASAAGQMEAFQKEGSTTSVLWFVHSSVGQQDTSSSGTHTLEEPLCVCGEELSCRLISALPVNGERPNSYSRLDKGERDSVIRQMRFEIEDWSLICKCLKDDSLS